MQKNILSNLVGSGFGQVNRCPPFGGRPRTCCLVTNLNALPNCHSLPKANLAGRFNCLVEGADIFLNRIQILAVIRSQHVKDNMLF